MLPGMNGFDVCKQIKTEKLTLPIIMLTAKSKEGDKVIYAKYSGTEIEIDNEKLLIIHESDIMAK